MRAVIVISTIFFVLIELALLVLFFTHPIWFVYCGIVIIFAGSLNGIFATAKKLWEQSEYWERAE